ncbi:hypothetical protein G9A89_001177 [Geosiphon pyriformis]|nr:hypothetical protein G9A89_001177 [Geosiphon pyriformis]
MEAPSSPPPVLSLHTWSEADVMKYIQRVERLYANGDNYRVIDNLKLSPMQLLKVTPADCEKLLHSRTTNVFQNGTLMRASASLKLEINRQVASLLPWSTDSPYFSTVMQMLKDDIGFAFDIFEHNMQGDLANYLRVEVGDRSEEIKEKSNHDSSNGKITFIQFANVGTEKETVTKKRKREQDENKKEDKKRKELSIEKDHIQDIEKEPQKQQQSQNNTPLPILPAICPPVEEEEEGLRNLMNGDVDPEAERAKIKIECGAQAEELFRFKFLSDQVEYCLLHNVISLIRYRRLEKAEQGIRHHIRSKMQIKQEEITPKERMFIKRCLLLTLPSDRPYYPARPKFLHPKSQKVPASSAIEMLGAFGLYDVESQTFVEVKQEDNGPELPIIHSIINNSSSNNNNSNNNNISSPPITKHLTFEEHRADLHSIF